MTQRYIDLAFDDISPRSFGGFDNENEATVIRLKVLDPDAKYYIEIEQACGKHDKYCSDVLPIADGYAAFEVSRDFTHETLHVQGVMKADGVCRKTARVRVGFSHSINALDELPESHPSWADSVDERLNELEQSSVIPDWNQNDESAQDYIKNRTHWKEENTEKYEKLKLTSYLQDGRSHFHSLGGQIRFGGEVDFSVYPFSLRYAGDPIYSDKIPLTALLLTSLAYTSCSGMSVYDEKEQLIGHFQFDALTFTAANDTYYTTVLLEIPYNFNTAYTVVLETKTTYHKISQEYLPENVLYSSKQSLTDKQQEQARANIGAFPERVIKQFWSNDHSVADIRDITTRTRYNFISYRGDDCNVNGVIINREIVFPCLVLSLKNYIDQVSNLVILDGTGRTLDITIHNSYGVVDYHWHGPILRTWTD